MLVLSRKVGETINFYEPQPDGTRRLLGSVMLLHASHGVARLGFEAPQDVEIVRGEIDEKEEAA